MKSTCSCVIKPDTPTTLPVELGGISSAHHSTPVASPARSTFPVTPPLRWLHHVPSEHGHGPGETCVGMRGTLTPPRGPAGRSRLALPRGMGLVILSPPLPPQCQAPRAKQHSSTAVSAAACSQLPKAGDTPPRCRVLSMLRPLCRCCFKQLLDG